MKTIRQIIRQPLKLISGILVVSLAVSVLCVCLGQSIAAERTQAAMAYSFTTIALPTTKYNYSDSFFTDLEGNQIPYVKWSETLPEEITEWIDDLVQTRGDLVETLANPGLASAYLPELTPDHLTQHNYYYPLRGTEEAWAPHRMETTATYACAMLEIELTEIGAPEELLITGTLEDGTEADMVIRISVELTGVIKSVVSLEEGYDDPTGRTIYLTFELQSREDLDAMELEEGQRYLVYGADYLDGEWALRGMIAESLSENLGYTLDYREIDIDRAVYLTEQEKQAFLQVNTQASIAPEATYSYGGVWTYVAKTEMDLKNAATLTIEDASAFGNYVYIWHESGGYPTINFNRYLTDENGNKVEITEEEWQERYQVPTIAPLDGTVEEFLASDEGALWRQQLEYMAVNYHAFPVIGVEKLGYIADFARETARIVEGRDFTAEELESGAKVCILSESLAAANGLTVGDTIRPQFYNYDYDSPNQSFISDGVGVVNPWAYSYAATTQWAAAEEYTIIGLYRQDHAWCDVSENLYSFTPNTIFVPHSAVTSDMDYGNQAFFQTLVLRNGAVEPFQTLVDEAGYEGLFVYYDQEYTTIMDTLMNYLEIAEKAMLIGIVVYAVILLLFLLLFPGSQGRVLNTMNALGAERSQQIAQVFLSGAGILLPGTILGTLLGASLWSRVVRGLAEGAGVAMTLKMEPMVLIGIALVQLILALLLNALLSLPMTRSKDILQRR
ncbi:MAG: ABC transporter permease [Firmicutes bacterium]|nr:ABC transporter permease [Bacillota bacterium]